MEQQELVVDSFAHKKNRLKIEKEEKELEALLKEHMGEQDDETKTESNGEGLEEPKVQTEGDTKQEEAKGEAETQEPEPELSAEEKSFKKRYGDLRRHSQEKEDKYKQELDKLKTQLDKAIKNELVLPKSTEEIEAWTKKYPDAAGFVEAIAEIKATEKAASLDERMKELEELRIQARIEKAEAELASYHPDFAQIRNSDPFHAWAKEQPKWVKDALYENLDDAKSVSRVIDLYKVDKGIVTKSSSNTKEKAAASSVKARKQATPEADEAAKYLTESAVSKMSMKEYEKRAEEIMEAQRSGKFIYDLSR
tara:strand:+ start:2234 stop:3160 length:927 start_codon:yes stop_codon:yes gene_type:complete